jgi:hypothetical protein
VQQLLAAYQRGAAVQELVERYKISKTSVLGLLHAHGVAVRTPRRLTDTEVQEAAELYRAGGHWCRSGRSWVWTTKRSAAVCARRGFGCGGCHEWGGAKPRGLAVPNKALTPISTHTGTANPKQAKG